MKRIDTPALLKQHGCSVWPAHVAPSVEQLEKIAKECEAKSRVPRYLDIKATPWCEQTWTGGSRIRVENDPAVRQHVPKAVAADSAGFTSLVSADAIVEAAALRSAAQQAKKVLPQAVHNAALNRLIHAMAVVGCFGPDGMRSAAVYLTCVHNIGALYGFEGGKRYDKALRREASQQHDVLADVKRLFSMRHDLTSDRVNRDLFREEVAKERSAVTLAPRGPGGALHLGRTGLPSSIAATTRTAKWARGATAEAKGVTVTVTTDTAMDPAPGALAVEVAPM